MSSDASNIHQFEIALPPPETDAVLKSKAHAAFVAYEAAIRDGDTDLAEAAAERFRTASESLKRSGKRAAEMSLGGRIQ